MTATDPHAGPTRGAPRAGIVVTGTEVLTGRVADRNGPWLSERLVELGLDHAHTTIVGDRPQDVLAALSFMAAEGVDLVITSGGLGPTADDLTAAVVGSFQERELALDEALEGRIADILRPLLARWPDLDLDAVMASNRKQALVPAGATVLEPVGTAPGLIVPPPATRAHPIVVVLPGPPRELQPMWRDAVQKPALGELLSRGTAYEQRTLRLYGIPESEIAETLRAAERSGVDLERLEVTTCLRRGEVEVVTRYEADASAIYAELEAVIRARHPDTLFSDDGSTVDQQVAALLRAGNPLGVSTIAVAESCTGGLLAARLTELPGSSQYMLGAIVAYSNQLKSAQAGVPAALIERHGAVSGEVAAALAAGAREQLGADVGVGVTGIAGPGGGTPEKPVGLVWLAVKGPGATSLTRSIQMPGNRADVRERSTTVAMHLLLQLLQGASDDEADSAMAR